MTVLVDATMFDRIGEQAQAVRPARTAGRWLALVAVSVLMWVGRVPAYLVTAVVWSCVAVREGYREVRPPAGRQLAPTRAVGPLARERIFRSVDRSRLVPEGDPGAAVLAYTPGQPMTAEDAAAWALRRPAAGRGEVAA